MLARALRSRLVAASAAGAILLAACGDRFTPPAAVVDGHRISQAMLERELDVVLTDPQTAADVRGPGGESRKKDLTRRVLYFLIQLRVVEEYAGAHAITVSRSEVDQQVAQAVRQFGGQQAFEAELKRRRLNLAQVQVNIERRLLLGKVENNLAGPTVTDQRQKDSLFDRWFRNRLALESIEVNPRFGRLDAGAGLIAPISSTGA